MAQDLERFEQGRSQHAVLPSRLFDNHLEQPALLGGGLLQEQLARAARQAQHVEYLIDWGRRGLLGLLDLALQPVLFRAPNRRCLSKNGGVRPSKLLLRLRTRPSRALINHPGGISERADS